MAKKLFFLGIILAASGFVSPPLALALGLIYAFTCAHPFHAESRQLSRFLLQASVVGLGFGMNLHQVIQAGRSGIVYTAAGITFVLALGSVLGRTLVVPRRVSFLISAGTAICGGSAIAAVGPISNATDDEMAVSLGTVFVLNSIALFAFPAIGTLLHLTQQQFGLWAALAIHDTSSVVGASAKYGAIALAVGTTVKLARAMWIVPVSLGTAAIRKRSTRNVPSGNTSSSTSYFIQLPWFILLFCLAAVANTYLPIAHAAYPVLKHLGMLGLTVTLFLIGTGLSRQAIRKVGARPMLQGIILWLIVATTSLGLIRAGWVHL